MNVPLRIIALAPNDWKGEWFNRQHLLSRLAKRHTVLYSNGIFPLWESNSDSYRSSSWLPAFEARDGVTLHVRGRFPTRVPRLPALDRWVLRQVGRQLRMRVGSAKGPLIAHVFNPEFEPYVEAISADFLVYHAYDLFKAMLGATEDVVHQEDRLLEKANLVIATSSMTARDLTKRGRLEAQVLGNGVDYDLFENAPDAPVPDIDRIPQPRIGYMGTLNPKVDYDLILALALRRKDWNFVLIGPARHLRPEDADLLQKLDSLRNFHRCDRVPAAELPRYLRRLDAGMICYRRSLGWPSACYPLKLMEYLASGIPVVSSDLEAVREFADDVAIAESVDDWETALRIAVQSGGVGTRESRQAVARANSWDARARHLERLLQDMISR